MYGQATQTKNTYRQTQQAGTHGEGSMARTRRHTLPFIPANKEAAANVQADAVSRGVGAVGLAAIGLIHLLDAPGTFADTRYIFWLYLALIAGCLCGAALLLRAPARLGWLAALPLSALPFLGYVLSRSTGLPGDMGDIGNWTEPLGLASLYVEACVFALGLYGLGLLRAPWTARQGRGGRG